MVYVEQDGSIGTVPMKTQKIAVRFFRAAEKVKGILPLCKEGDFMFRMEYG